MRLPSLALVLALLFTCLSGAALADVDGERARIAALADRIKAAAAAQDDSATLHEARKALERALDRLQGDAPRRRGGGQRDACVQFAQQIHAEVWPAQSALERALVDCKPAVDVEVLRFAQQVYGAIYGAGGGLERAFLVARREALARRGALLRFAYDIYQSTYGTPSALERAVQFVTGVPRRQDRCVRTAFPTYKQVYGDVSALERAAKACQE